MPSGLKVLVLAGGPDRERAVSLLSGAEVATAMRAAGHDVREADITPNDLKALDEFGDWRGDVIFPVLHGSWGEGGGLQRVLDERGVCYVGCGSVAAELCMDKHRTKLALAARRVATPDFELLTMGETPTLDPPMVLKPPREGSSIDLFICRDVDAVSHALAALHERHSRLLAERFVAGVEITVGVIGVGEGGPPVGPVRGRHQALPPIAIVPATEYYDYDAKYTRDDTRYLVGPEQIDLPAEVLEQAQHIALEAHYQLGCRHLSRVDFIVDAEHRPWVLEINTLPGFTTHSLLPMAARDAGLDMPALVDHLVTLAKR